MGAFKMEIQDNTKQLSIYTTLKPVLHNNAFASIKIVLTTCDLFFRFLRGSNFFKTSYPAFQILHF